MNSILLENASKVVPNIGTLVNMMRLRVRQLLAGSRPLTAAPPGMGLSDIALSEIGAEKLVWEPVVAVVAELPAAIIKFPKLKPAVKAA